MLRWPRASFFFDEGEFSNKVRHNSPVSRGNYSGMSRHQTTPTEHHIHGRSGTFNANRGPIEQR